MIVSVWVCWFISMVFFLYIVFELMVGLSAATNAEEDAGVKGKIKLAQIMTVISWCTCPVVCLLPMSGIRPGARRVEAVSQPRHESLAEAAPCHRSGGSRRDDPFGLHAFGCISAPRSCESALVNGQLLISVVAW